MHGVSTNRQLPAVTLGTAHSVPASATCSGQKCGVSDRGRILHTLGVLAEWLCMQPRRTSALFNWLAPFSLSLSFLFSLEGDALLDAGESMKRLAEVKDSLDIEVKQNFIDPLQNLCDKDLKEIQVNTSMFFSPHHLFRFWPLLGNSAFSCLLCCGGNQGLTQVPSPALCVLSLPTFTSISSLLSTAATTYAACKAGCRFRWFFIYRVLWRMLWEYVLGLLSLVLCAVSSQPCYIWAT